MHRLHRIGGPSSAVATNSSDLPHLRPYDGKIAGLYDLEETLGRGHFAVVKLARHVFTGEKVAVKVIDKSKLDEVSKAHLFQEVRCMKLVQHPNVVRLYEVIDTATKLYLILELGDGGDLYEYIIRHEQGLPEDNAKDYFKQIVRAISYCHQLHVVHRDLKPENVVFFKKLGVVKLTDFGFSNKFYPGQKLETSCGSLAYSAPEILLGDSYDAPAVDVWSLGVILYMLVCGQAPFQEANDSETLTMIMDCKYNVPPHVSYECRDLISRMLVRNPEKRATLNQISHHPWLISDGNNEENNLTLLDTLTLPLISKENLSEDDHNFIVQKIVNGHIATKEEVQECLDRNEYNHITATYYLLAERKLRAKRVDVVNKCQRPENLAVSKNLGPPKRENGAGGSVTALLNVPRTPGDVPQRSRKCSIVQEDEEEEETGREELGPPLNRRGSRSEGRLNLALQERLSDSEKRKICTEKISESTDKNRQKWKANKSSSVVSDSTNKNSSSDILPTTTTTIITDSSTITIPIITTSEPVDCSALPKYKTMPSSTTRTINNIGNELIEIFEEDSSKSDSTTTRPSSATTRFVKHTPYEQRRSKFHKSSRTASCSSSDASDDDSEKRKNKQTNKLNPTSSKPILQGRRDSYDDSSDSQEPGTTTGAGAAGNQSISSSGGTTFTISTGNSEGNSQKHENKKNTNNDGGGKKNTTNNALGRQHKASRRRGVETRLRESQSLNRITEVQEDHALVISTTVVGTPGSLTPKVKGFGARLLQGLNISSKKNNNDNECKHHISRKDTVKSSSNEKSDPLTQSEKKKLRILGKYFQVHKKLCIPLPSVLFSKNSRLYKAQSCGSLSRDKINKTDRESVLLGCRQRAVSVFRNSLGLENFNHSKDARRNSSATVVQLNNVCNNELTGMCAIHLEQTSKCNFC